MNFGLLHWRNAISGNFSNVSKSGDENSADQRNLKTGIDGDELLCLTDFYFTYTPRKYLFVKKKLTPEDEEICDLRMIDVQLRTSEHRSMYSYVRLSIDRCTATYV